MKRANRVLVSGAVVASVLAGSLLFTPSSAEAAQRRNRRRNRNNQTSRLLKDLATSAALSIGGRYLSRQGGSLAPIIGAIAGSGLLGGGRGNYVPYGGGGYNDPYGSGYYYNNR